MALYIFFYAFLVFTAIIILHLGAAIPARPNLLDLSVGFGFIGLSMMVLQFISSARFKFLNNPFGTDLVYHFHRQMGILSLKNHQQDPDNQRSEQGNRKR